MSARPSLAERAYEIARSGQVAKVKELRIRLVKEGYDFVDQHLASRTLNRSLRAVMEGAGAFRSPDAG